MRPRSSYLNTDFFIAYDTKQEGDTMVRYHYHNVYELYVLLDGERTLVINDSIYSTTSCDLAFICPNDFHRSYGTTPYKGICINFSDDFLDRYYTKEAKAQLLPYLHSSVTTLSKDELHYVHNISNTCILHPDHPLLCVGVFLSLLQTSYLNRLFEHKVTSEPIPSTMISYLNAHFTEQQSLELIADTFYISKSHLCYLFKQQTGLTILEYIHELRIKKACELLTQTNKTVNAIGRECGFQTTVYFNRIFKRLTRSTPVEYRFQEHTR